MKFIPALAAVHGATLLLLAGCGSSDTRSSDDPNGIDNGTNEGTGGAVGYPPPPPGTGGNSVVGVGSGGGPFVGGGSGGAPFIGGGTGGSTGFDTGGSPGLGGAIPGWNGDCNLHTNYAGDDRCILPPPPDEGFQVHIGPADYDNPEQMYVLAPGDEATTDFPAESPNDVDRFFFYRQYRMRPTAHHMILTAGSSSSILGGLGRRIATANISGDSPPGGNIAPENVGVGSPIAARSKINVSLHAINTGDTPQLREIWVNFWYRDAALVTEPAEPWFKVGSASFSVAPHQDTVLGPYSCSVPTAGRLLWLYGHRHANNVEFAVSRVRGAQRDLIYEGLHWEDPITLEYNTLIQNPAPDAASLKEGGWSGILDLLPGDRIEWSCHVVNTQNTTLRFTNETYLGEMCIVDAEAVGTGCTGI